MRHLSGPTIDKLRHTHPEWSYTRIGEYIAELEGRRIRYTDATIGKVYRAWRKQQGINRDERKNLQDQGTVRQLRDP